VSLDLKKTLQAAALLARLEPGSTISRMRLLKLLYIADREALKEIGRTISNDAHAALKKGPILSGFYNVIKGEDVGSRQFERHFESIGYRLKLIRAAGIARLNRFEIRKLHEVSERFSAADDEDLSEITHDFAEWKKNKPLGNSSNPIPFDQLVEAVGRKEKKKAARRRAVLHSAIDELWG